LATPFLSQESRAEQFTVLSGEGWVRRYETYMQFGSEISIDCKIADSRTMKKRLHLQVNIESHGEEVNIIE
jgi:hypothetical protein